MAQFKPHFANPLQLQSKAQPRRLPRWELSHPCNETDCTAPAVSQHKDHFYCAVHLLKTLQQQWQE
jgi:hypothetical protein